MEVRAFMTTCVHTQKNLSRYIVEVRATHLGLPQCFRSAAMAQISLRTRANSLDHSCSRDHPTLEPIFCTKPQNCYVACFINYAATNCNKGQKRMI